MANLAQWEQYLSEELVASQRAIQTMPDAEPQNSGIKINELNWAKRELFIEFRIQLTLVNR